MAVRHDREFWKRACREVGRGAKVDEVARRLGVKPRTLQWWSWKLGERRRTKRTEFLPVVVREQAAPEATASLEIETKGIRVSVEIGADVRYLAALVAALRAAC